MLIIGTNLPLLRKRKRRPAEKRWQDEYGSKEEVK